MCHDFNKPSLSYVIFEWISFHTPFSDIMYKDYITSLPLGSKDKVLELGSGGGVVSKYLTRILRNGFLTCVDTAERWVNTAKRRFKNKNNIEILLGDVRKLKIKDSFYNGVIIHFMLHDIFPEEDRIPILKTLVRKLKKNGKLFICEPTKKIKPRDVDALMKKAGLRKDLFKMGDPAFLRSHMGRTYEAIFIKK